jgi:DUF2934 family protein
MKQTATAKKQSTGPEVAQTQAARAKNARSREEVQQRAYEINMERGGADGQDIDDWLAAEREVLAKHPTPSSHGCV